MRILLVWLVLHFLSPRAVATGVSQYQSEILTSLNNELYSQLEVPWYPVRFLQSALRTDHFLHVGGNGSEGNDDGGTSESSSLLFGVIDAERVRRFLWSMMQGMGTSLDWIYIGWRNGGLSCYAQDGDAQTWIWQESINYTW